MDSWRRSKLVDAVTAGEDKPSAGVWQLDELVQYVQSSNNGGTRSDVAATLMRRLNGDSPVVKAKCLKSIKYLCQKDTASRTAFHSTHAAVIREYVKYNGRQDVLKGDTLNKAVREAASDALKAIFDDGAGYGSPTTSPESARISARIEGFGSSSSTSSGGAGFTNGYRKSGPDFGASSNGGSNGRMVGFGSNSFKTTSFGSNNGGNHNYGSSFSNRSTYSSQQYTSPEPIRNEVLQNDYYDSSPAKTASGLTFAGKSQPIAPTSIPTGSAEEQLVSKMCTPSGVGRAQPSPKDLDQFVRAVSNMDGRATGKALASELEGAAWQPAFRALCYIEACIREGQTASCGEMIQIFSENPEPIRKLTKSPQASVSERAKRLLSKVGGDVVEMNGIVEHGHGTQNGVSKDGGALDLLGGLQTLEQTSKTGQGSSDSADVIPNSQLYTSPEPIASTSIPKGSAEEQLVSKMCTPSGVGRAQPSPKDLDQFVRAVSNMDGRATGKALASKLEGAAWQPAFRALCYIEACIREGQTASYGEMIQIFSENPEPIRKLTKSPQASVSERAKRLLSKVGGDVVEMNGIVEHGHGTQNGVSKDGGALDLLGGLQTLEQTSKTGQGSSDSADVIPSTQLFDGLSLGTQHVDSVNIRSGYGRGTPAVDTSDPFSFSTQPEMQKFSPPLIGGFSLTNDQPVDLMDSGMQSYVTPSGLPNMPGAATNFTQRSGSGGSGPTIGMMTATGSSTPLRSPRKLSDDSRKISGLKQTDPMAFDFVAQHMNLVKTGKNQK